MNKNFDDRKDRNKRDNELYIKEFSYTFKMDLHYEYISF